MRLLWLPAKLFCHPGFRVLSGSETSNGVSIARRIAIISRICYTVVLPAAKCRRGLVLIAAARSLRVMLVSRGLYSVHGTHSLSHPGLFTG